MTQGLTVLKWSVPGKLGERTHPACYLRHLAANLSQRTTSYPPGMEVLMAEGRKRMLSAFPPEPPLWQVPKVDSLRARPTLGCATNPLQGFTSERAATCLVEALPRRGCDHKPNVGELPASLRWEWCRKCLLRRSFGGLTAFRI